MKRRRVILIAAVCLVAVAVAFLVWPGEREPENQGKKLSEWLELAYPTAIGANELTTAQEARTAIRHVGTNAIPYLLKWIQYERPKWRVGLAGLAGKLHISRAFIVEHIEFSKAEARAEHAAEGFQLLGLDGGAAAPELIRLMDQPNSASTRSRAFLAAYNMGLSDLHSIVNETTNKARASRQ